MLLHSPHSPPAPPPEGGFRRNGLETTERRWQALRRRAFVLPAAVAFSLYVGFRSAVWAPPPQAPDGPSSTNNGLGAVAAGGAPPTSRPRLGAPRDFLLRYTMLAPTACDLHHLGKEFDVAPLSLPEQFAANVLPFARPLAASVCSSETYLAPAVMTGIHGTAGPEYGFGDGTVLKYVIYTDNCTHAAVRDTMEYLLGGEDKAARRVKLVNLDEDAGDAARMERPKSSYLNTLDDRNMASVRRTLADAAVLPAAAPRLLLGTDAYFVTSPRELLSEMRQRGNSGNSSVGIYVADRSTFNGRLYRILNWKGPQCAGLLGDAIYLSPGVNVTVHGLLWAMEFYAAQPKDSPRIDPPCDFCDKISGGMHAVDQFGWVMALGEALGDESRCVPLSLEGGQHWIESGQLRHNKRVLRYLTGRCSA